MKTIQQKLRRGVIWDDDGYPKAGLEILMDDAAEEIDRLQGIISNLAKGLDEILANSNDK